MATDIAEVFIDVKRTWGCMMMLEGSAAEDLSRMQNRKSAASHILMRALFHKRKEIQEYSE